MRLIDLSAKWIIKLDEEWIVHLTILIFFVCRWMQEWRWSNERHGFLLGIG